MKLYIPLPSVFRFQELFDESEYLQRYLTQDTRTMSVWYIEDGIDLNELIHVLKENKIRHKFKDE